jgi:calpain-15
MSATDSKAPLRFSDINDFRSLGRRLHLSIIKSASNLSKKAEVVQLYKTTGQKFTDEEFLTVRSSLIKNWYSADHDTQRSWRYFNWRRIDEIYAQPIKVFDNVEPNDIRQGALGNCYFLSALSALAEFPFRIQRLFDIQEYEPAGAYVVFMCDVGEVKAYVLDDYFPVTTLGRPAFSGPRVEKGTSELWVILLEKAWAKRFGCYYSISEGITNDVLRDFTGAPCEDISTQNEHLWSELVEADRKNFIITAASGGAEDAHDTVDSLGLISLHAYSLIKVREVTSANITTRLLQIRNPWGGTEWTGDWSDSSSLWTEDLKQELGWTAEDDGTFWMALEDFKTHFTAVTICRANDHYYYKNVQATQSPGGFKVFEVEVDDEAELYAIVTQVDERRFEKTSGYEYSTVRIIGAYKEEATGTLHYLGGRANTSLRDVWEEFRCPRAGTYVFYVEMEWLSSLTERFGFSVYASKVVAITEATDKYPDFPLLVYNIDSARAHGKPKELGPGMMMYSSVRSGTSNDFKFMEGFIYDAFENSSPNLRLLLDIRHRTLSNLALLSPMSESFELSLGPGESVVVVKKQVDMLSPQSFSMVMKKQIVG